MTQLTIREALLVADQIEWAKNIDTKYCSWVIRELCRMLEREILTSNLEKEISMADEKPVLEKSREQQSYTIGFKNGTLIAMNMNDEGFVNLRSLIIQAQRSHTSYAFSHDTVINVDDISFICPTENLIPIQ